MKDLTSKNLPFYRLNTEDIGDTVQVDFDFSNHSFSIVDKTKVAVIDLLKVKSVYFRRPEINEQLGELSLGERNFIRSELLFTLEGLFRVLGKAFWVNTVWAIRNAENKIHQLLIAKQIGFTIPDAVITNIPNSAQKFYRKKRWLLCHQANQVWSGGRGTTSNP